MLTHDRFVHQAESASSARNAITVHGRALIVLAPALGKTRTSALVWHGAYPGPGLFLVHSHEILRHAIKEYEQVYGHGAKLTLFTGSMQEIAGSDVVFATVQMLHNHRKRFARDHFKWMTVDETHHAQARTWRAVINHFKGCPRLGITATPDRMDMLDIREMFGNETVNIPIEDAAARGWFPLVEYRVLTDHGLDERMLNQALTEVQTQGRRPSLAEINRRIFVRSRDEEAAKLVESYDVPTVIFCRTIKHAEHFQGFLTSAECYHSRQSPDKNSEVLARLRSGETRRVLAVDAFNEGVDVPALGLVVFYRSTQSDRIFRQQLGRGLRLAEGKRKLTVLDFVANVHRVIILHKTMGKIALLHKQYATAEERAREGFVHDVLHLSGIGFDFTFAEHVVDIMEILRRANVEPYPTWQEASEAARALGITDRKEYRLRRHEDERLPGAPHWTYGMAFPGYAAFFGRPSDTYAMKSYNTWQEASVAARALGITSVEEYRMRRKEDPRLPGSPALRYSDFPGFAQFLCTERRVIVQHPYAAYAEARQAVQALAIQSSNDYARRYRSDPRLPGNPPQKYGPDFRGWDDFLGRLPRYRTLAEAGAAAKTLGITSASDYVRRYKEDPRLVREPKLKYRAEWKGWTSFLGG